MDLLQVLLRQKTDGVLHQVVPRCYPSPEEAIRHCTVYLHQQPPSTIRQQLSNNLPGSQHFNQLGNTHISIVTSGCHGITTCSLV